MQRNTSRDMDLRFFAANAPPTPSWWPEAKLPDVPLIGFLPEKWSAEMRSCWRDCQAEGSDPPDEFREAFDKLKAERAEANRQWKLKAAAIKLQAAVAWAWAWAESMVMAGEAYNGDTEEAGDRDNKRPVPRRGGRDAGAVGPPV